MGSGPRRVGLQFLRNLDPAVTSPPGGRSARKNALQLRSIDDRQPAARWVAGCASASPGSSNLAWLADSSSVSDPVGMKRITRSTNTTTAPTGRVAAFDAVEVAVNPPAEEHVPDRHGCWQNRQDSREGLSVVVQSWLRPDGLRLGVASPEGCVG
jgi:hypothetical protein